MERKIIHVDMDAFYASVEQRDRPELRGRPVIVGGSPEGRGVVAAASYEARKFGIHSALPASRARRLCPQAVFVPPRFTVYRDISRQIREIFREYTDLIEPIALDEAYLDVTRHKTELPYASTIARNIRERIRNELRLTASAGVGPCKFIAKLASDMRKPDGLVVVPPARVREFLDPLPIEKLWGVGPATAPRIRALGVQTLGELSALPLSLLERELGSMGRFIHNLAKGVDHRVVRPGRPAKSRGAERTFSRDLSDLQEMKRILSELTTLVAEAIRRMERPARTVTVKVRYDDFATVTRSQTLGHYVDNEELILPVVWELLGQTEADRRPVRLLGVTLSNLLQPDDPAQLEFPFMTAKSGRDY